MLLNALANLVKESCFHARAVVISRPVGGTVGLVTEWHRTIDRLRLLAIPGNVRVFFGDFILAETMQDMLDTTSDIYEQISEACSQPLKRERALPPSPTPPRTPSMNRPTQNRHSSEQAAAIPLSIASAVS
jgi:hypothetical protein